MGFLLKSICTIVETEKKAKFWNRLQWVNFSTRSKYSLM
jgi:hypothetical protein